MFMIKAISFITVQVMIIMLQVVVGAAVGIVWFFTMITLIVGMTAKWALPKLYKKAIEWRFK